MSSELKAWLEDRRDWHYKMAAYCLEVARKPSDPDAHEAYINDAHNLAREGRLFEMLLCHYDFIHDPYRCCS